MHTDRLSESALGGRHTDAKLLFLDFSLTFTIQPLLLTQRLICHFELDPNLIGRIMDF